MASKYQKIVTHIKDAIDSGQLKKGDKVPSIRWLSRHFEASKDTAQRALLELKYKNYIYAVEKSGYYVLVGDFQDEKDLDLSLSDYNNIAYEDFRLCMTETLINRDNYLFNYHHQQQGLEELRQSLKNYLVKDAIYAKENNIIVTSGTQQALYILSLMTFPNAKENILLEQPTYDRMIDLVSKQKLPYQTIARDFSGIDLQELENLFREGNIKFFYTISRFSNPLGLSYSNADKQKIVALAEQYDVYIVEDDYMGDFAKSNDLPLHYYDTSDHVIYLKSFSMTIFPALRLGNLILPQVLTKLFLDYKKLIDYDTNLIMQKALSLYLDNGMFEKNINYLKQVFKKQVEKAETVLTSFHNIGSYSLTPQYLVLELPESSHLGDRLLNEKITILNKHSITANSKKYLQVLNDKELCQNLNLILK